MKKSSQINTINIGNGKNSQTTDETDKPSDDNLTIEKLEQELTDKNEEIIDLKRKFEDSKKRIHEAILDKGSLEKRVNELELKELSIKFVKCEELKNEFNKLEHRMQVTKKQLDDARNHIKSQEQFVESAKDKVEFMEKVIEDLENRSLTDYLRSRFPETFMEYKKK